MQTPAFLANPIGVDYVPEEIIARLAAGVNNIHNLTDSHLTAQILQESDSEVMTRPACGARGPETVPIPPQPSRLVKT